jgi:nucleoid-associated protein YgaU
MSTPEALAALHHRRGNELEQQELLRQALDEQLIALTISPQSEPARAAAQRLADKIERKVGELTEQARQFERGAREARERNLAILALDPKNRPAFEALRTVARESTDRGRATRDPAGARDTNAITHTVRAGDTLTSLATLYYGDPTRADVIAGANQITADTALARGRKLQIPEIPGVPLLPH